MKIALGTVQFGMRYGVANRAGRVPLTEVKDILEQSAAVGIDTLDTAIAYGDSEAVLGEIGVDRWHVVTKLPTLPDGVSDVTAWVATQIEASLNRLGVSRLYGVLLHRPDQLLGNNGKSLIYALQHIKELGYTEKIGISAYCPDEIDNLASACSLDLVQAPLNILDRRLITSGCASRLKDRGIELHVRSIFLQGLLLMPEGSYPEKFQRWSPLWAHWHQWLRDSSLDAVQACLAYVMAAEEVDRVVVGVDSVAHLNEILMASHSSLATFPDFEHLVDVALLNPSCWSQL